MIHDTNSLTVVQYTLVLGSGASTPVWHTLDAVNIVRKEDMKTFLNAALLLALASATATAQINAGEQKPEPTCRSR